MTKKVTRSDAGVQYKGIDFWRGYLSYNQLSQPYVTPGTFKATINNEGWKTLFEPVAKLYSIPGNEYKSGGMNTFIKDKKMAMYVTYNIIMLLKDAPDLHWDLVTMPTFTQKPKTGVAPFPQHMLVTAQSKHKDEAFLALEVALSDEVQAARARDAGIAPALVKESVRNQFMKGVEFAAGKNVGAFFKLQSAQPRIGTPYDQLGISAVSSALTEVLQGKKDVNTALRDAEEKTDQQIKVAKEGGK
jgi:multiple sugar transport system substrate-binding protein